jgi:hypothetical protein
MRPIRRTLTLSVLAVVSVALLGAGYPVRSAKTVSPKKYAKSVCTSVGAWVQTMQDGSTKVQSDLDANPVGNLDGARNALTTFMGNAVASTDTLLHQLAKAGRPSTPKGKQVAKRLVTGFKGIRNLLDEARNSAQALATGDPQAFTDGAQRVQGAITTGFDDFSKAFNSLDKLDTDHKLGKAFRAEKACQALSQ